MKTSTAADRDNNKRSFGEKTRIWVFFAQARNSKFIYTALEKTSEGLERSKASTSLIHNETLRPNPTQQSQGRLASVSKNSFLTKGSDSVPEDNEVR